MGDGNPAGSAIRKRHATVLLLTVLAVMLVAAWRWRKVHAFRVDGKQVQDTRPSTPNAVGLGAPAMTEGVPPQSKTPPAPNFETPPPPSGEQRSIGAAFLATAVIAPTAAALASIAGTIVHPDFTQVQAIAHLDIGMFLTRPHPLATAVLDLVGVWLLLALLYWSLGYTSPRGASTGSYGDLWTEVAELDAWIRYRGEHPERATSNQDQVTALYELIEQRGAIWRECTIPGSQWVMGTGYVALWRRLHRAQQALLELAPPGSALKRAHYDYIRLKGSTVPYSSTYQDLLLKSIDLLSRASRASIPSALALLNQTEDVLVRQPIPSPDVSASYITQSKFAIERVCEELGSFSIATLGSVKDCLSQSATSPGASSPDLLKNVREATAMLRPFVDAVSPLDVLGTASTGAAEPVSTTAAVRSTQAATVEPDHLPAPRSVQEATDLVRVANRAIDEFRDDSRASLVRERGHLTMLVGFTAITGYTLLWIAIAMNAPPGSIGAGAIYFLVGALVGLFTHLHTGDADLGVDDFGTSETHMLATPLLSGVAAVIGVTLLARGTNATQGATQGPGSDLLSKAFDLQAAPVNVFIAAAFGFTPKLLIDRLTAKVDSYKHDLKTSEASASISPSTVEPRAAR